MLQWKFNHSFSFSSNNLFFVWVHKHNSVTFANEYYKYKIMKADLIVNNFGPIKSVNLDLRNVNVFIGPQASGKSALAKVYTICKSPLSFFKEDANEAANVVNFKKKLDDYNIGSFIKEDTYIEFSSELHYFKFEKNQIVYKRYLLQKINRLDCLITDDSNNNEIVETIWELRNKLYSFHQYILKNILNANATTSKEVLRTELQKLDFDFKILESIVNGLNDLEFSLSINPALYIPSERGIIPIIRGTILNLLNNDVPLPKHILAFGAEYEKASALKNVLDLGFIQENLSYKFENGE